VAPDVKLAAGAATRLRSFASKATWAQRSRLARERHTVLRFTWSGIVVDTGGPMSQHCHSTKWMGGDVHG
jgi:hypothetical protein